MAEEKKPGFFNRLKEAATGEFKRALGAGEPLPKAAPRELRRPGQGGLPTTDRLAKPAVPTGRLGASATRTSELKSEGPAPSQAELSPKRLAIIEDFVQGRLEVARMNEPTYMYKLVADERAYQTIVLKDLRARLNGLADPHGEEARALEARIKRTSMVIQNLFRVLKMITGKQGNTGGTDFLQ